MPRKVNFELDHQVIEYLKDHSWVETQNHFGLSSGTLKNIKDRNTPKDQDGKSTNEKIGINSEIKKDVQILIELFKKALDIEDFEKMVSESESKAISRLELVI